ncbi:hypothetical protein [Streptomyces sp. NPDC049040]|uniref:hypothetical protein n=1 Tax=Streptomyces sp. NPDC049040 TaxID=3365593 RepID=UPI00371E320D
MTHDDDAVAVGTLLARLAESEPLPPPPSSTSLISGGRRRLVRRRAVLAGAAALAVTAVGTAVALPGTAAHHASAPAASKAGPAPAKPTTPPAADPMKPSSSVVIGQGTDNQGHTWRVSARLWPAPRTHDEALAQLRAIAADEKFPPGWGPIDDSWVPPQFEQKHLQVSGSLDGERYPNPSYDDAGQSAATTSPYTVASGVSGVLIGPESRIGQTRTLVGAVADDIRRVNIRWSDGTSSDAPLVRVAGSTQRWFAVRAQHGLTGVVTEYGAGDRVIMRDTKSFGKKTHF